MRINSMHKKKPVYLWMLPAFLILFIASKASASFKMERQCIEAYQLIWQYQCKEALEKINLIEKQQPENKMVLYLRETAYFMQAFITEEAAHQKEYTEAYNAVFSQLNKADALSPWSAFIKAEANIHQSLLLLKKSSYLSAAYNLSKAYSQLQESLSKDSNFLPAKKNLLMMKAGIGSVPDNYRWMLSILGFKAELAPSMLAYSRLIKDMEGSEYDVFLEETELMYGYMQLYLMNDSEKAWDAVNKATANYTKSQIFGFARAGMANRMKKNDIALQTLSAFCTPDKTPSLYMLDYQYGTAKLQKGDKEAAFYLGRFLRNYKGENYQKDAYLKLGWAFLISGDDKSYLNCMKLVQVMGKTDLEEDANALRESQIKTKPLLPLLKARLYYDGGYYTQASESLHLLVVSSLNADQLSEYYYRQARISEALGQNEEALNSYGKLITENAQPSTYFPAAACVFSAQIYESKGDRKKALFYYNRTFAYKNYPYKNAFDQKAQAGLRRLEAKK